MRWKELDMRIMPVCLTCISCFKAQRNHKIFKQILQKHKSFTFVKKDIEKVTQASKIKVKIFDKLEVGLYIIFIILKMTKPHNS